MVAVTRILASCFVNMSSNGFEEVESVRVNEAQPAEEEEAKPADKDLLKPPFSLSDWQRHRVRSNCVDCLTRYA